MNFTQVGESLKICPSQNNYCYHTEKPNNNHSFLFATYSSMAWFCDVFPVSCGSYFRSMSTKQCIHHSTRFLPPELGSVGIGKFLPVDRLLRDLGKHQKWVEWMGGQDVNKSHEVTPLTWNFRKSSYSTGNTSSNGGCFIAMLLRSSFQGGRM